jgi:hypothetical protein
MRSTRRQPRFTRACVLLIGIFLASIGVYSASAQLQMTSVNDMRPRLEEVVSRMMAYRQWQDSSLREYQARRRFRASNPRFNMDSFMEVQTTFRWPYSLHSTVVKQEGSDFIREHVFQKILEAETDLAAKDDADIVPKNYDFGFLGKEDCNGRPCWHLALKPKRKDKFLIDGDLWVDAADYAVSRVHGVPSKHVSMWVSRVVIDRELCRINGVWLDQKIESSSSIHLVGNVSIQIEYSYDKVKVVSATSAQNLAPPSNQTN